jgi:hypothetical protein
MNRGTNRGTLRQTAALQGSVVVAAVMFPFRGTDYGTTASPAKTGVRHQAKPPMGQNHDLRGRRLATVAGISLRARVSVPMEVALRVGAGRIYKKPCIFFLQKTAAATH